MVPFFCKSGHEKRIRFLFAVVQHVTSEKSFYFLCVREFSAIELRKDLIPVVHSYSAGYVGNSGLRGPGPVEACFMRVHVRVSASFITRKKRM